MAKLRKGDKVDVWGPLGNYFAMERDTPTLLVAGGMGIAPFVGYANLHPQPWNLSMLFGHKEPLGCYPVDSINERAPVDCLREAKEGDLDNFIYTLQERVHDCAEQGGLILVCGPDAMLRTARKFAKAYKARMQLSLERHMACGVGACLGCVATTPEGKPLQTCLHGPVFWADQIDI